MKYPRFVGPSFVSQSPIADQEELYNFYPERLESGGAVVPWALYPTPGFEQIDVAATGPGSAHFFQNGREFCVIGTSFYEVSSTGVLTSRGTVATNTNPATISSNGDGGNQLLVTSGSNGYVYDLAADTLTQVSFLDGKATMGRFFDSYFVVLDTSTSTLWVSDLLDGTTWDPTQYAQRSIASDNWVSMEVSNRLLYLFGSQTSEVWHDTGAAPFPFAPHPSGLFQYGCAASFSPKIVAGAVVWLASSAVGRGSVMQIRGFTPEVISTDPVEYAVNNYTAVSDAIGDTYDDLGHTFYVLTFPTANVTWSWDAQTSLWHKRGTWNQATGSFDAQRAFFHAFAFGEHRLLDRSSAQLLRMSSTIGTDVDSLPIVRVRRAPALVYENQRLYYNLFELLLEPGLGLSSGQGSNPLAMMRCSNDGGKTWGPQRFRTAGELGKYNTRVRWLRCGSARKRVFEVSFSDPIPWRILDAFLEVEGLPRQAAA